MMPWFIPSISAADPHVSHVPLAALYSAILQTWSYIFVCSLCCSCILAAAASASAIPTENHWKVFKAVIDFIISKNEVFFLLCTAICIYSLSVYLSIGFVVFSISKLQYIHTAQYAKHHQQLHHQQHISTFTYSCKKSSEITDFHSFHKSCSHTLRHKVWQNIWGKRTVFHIKS